MRNQLTTTRLAAWMFAPLLFACGSEGATGGDLVNVPACDVAGQVLSTDSTGQLICKDLPAGALVLPNCHKYSEALTSDGKGVSCTTRNNESQASRDALNNLESSEKLINDYTTRLSKITGGPAARAVYCGQSATNTNGAITSGGFTGIAGATDLCRKVATCGNTGRMCTVYDMYYSVAAGAIKATDTIAKSWVYMASWANFGQANQQEPTAGMNDNCGAFTYPTGDRKWQGTAVKWENAATGSRALKFYSGVPQTLTVNGTTSTFEGAQCSEVLPVACCK